MSFHRSFLARPLPLALALVCNCSVHSPPSSGAPSNGGQAGIPTAGATLTEAPGGSSGGFTRGGTAGAVSGGAGGAPGDAGEAGRGDGGNPEVGDGAATWEVMKYGLFVHYVFGGELAGMTPLQQSGGFPQNIDELANRFDVEKFAHDVASMGVEYVIFTVWHANMGVLYPSEVMRRYQFDQWEHFTTARDLPDAVTRALAARGIKTLLYTHIWVGHDFHPAGDGYFSFSNTNGTVTSDMLNTGYAESVQGDPLKWNDFVAAIYGEMSERYGTEVIGYWFDGTWTDKVDKQRIMSVIGRTHPAAAFVANGGPAHGLPFGAKEVGWAGPEADMSGDYPPVKNGDVSTWPSYQRSIALLASGNWWATTGGRVKYDASTIYRYTVLQAASSVGGGISWAMSPFVDGSWEPGAQEAMAEAYAVMKPVEQSIKRTRPSTSFITAEGSKIGTLPRGFVATTSADGRYEYIHVLTPPSVGSIELPDPADGRTFDGASLLATGEPARLEKTEGGYRITLPLGASWHGLNTVFRLTVR